MGGVGRAREQPGKKKERGGDDGCALAPSVRPPVRPPAESARTRTNGKKTHHIVKLDAVLEAEVVEFLIGCWVIGWGGGWGERSSAGGCQGRAWGRLAALSLSLLQVCPLSLFSLLSLSFIRPRRLRGPRSWTGLKSHINDSTVRAPQRLEQRVPVDSDDRHPRDEFSGEIKGGVGPCLGRPVVAKKFL